MAESVSHSNIVQRTLNLFHRSLLDCLANELNRIAALAGTRTFAGLGRKRYGTGGISNAGQIGIRAPDCSHSASSLVGSSVEAFRNSWESMFEFEPWA